MRIQYYGMLFISFIALLLVIGCAEQQKTETDKKETISPATAEAAIQEVTLNVTGMT